MKKLAATCFSLVFTLYVNAQWFNVTSPVSVNLYSTVFTGVDTGYAVGGDLNSSVFLKTEDGGSTWNTITNAQTKWLYDVVFLNDTLGIACGYEGAIYKTTNAGISWSSKPSQTTAWLYAVASRPDGVLYAVGTDGAMVKSTNLGDNWNPVVSNTSKTMLDVTFYDNNHGAAVGYSGEMIYTTDGGNNWAVKLMGTTGNMTGLWMQSTDTMFVCGFGGKLYKTMNAGQSFVLSTLSSNDLNSIYFVDDNVGYVCGHQVIFETTDGGSTWNPVTPLPTASTLRDIYVLPDNVTMYAVGANGSIIKNINTIGFQNEVVEAPAVFPNPCTNGFTAFVKGNGMLRLLDNKGGIVKNISMPNNEQSVWINTEGFNSGVYFLELIQNGNYSVSKIIVNN